MAPCEPDSWRRGPREAQRRAGYAIRRTRCFPPGADPRRYGLRRPGGEPAARIPPEPRNPVRTRPTGPSPGRALPSATDTAPVGVSHSTCHRRPPEDLSPSGRTRPTNRYGPGSRKRSWLTCPKAGVESPKGEVQGALTLGSVGLGSFDYDVGTCTETPVVSVVCRAQPRSPRCSGARAIGVAPRSDRSPRFK